MDISKEIQDGQEAKHIIESDVYKRAIQALADGYQNQWMNSKPNDVQERERVYTKLQILADFVNEIRSVMETGQMAEHERRKTENIIGTHY